MKDTKNTKINWSGWLEGKRKNTTVVYLKKNRNNMKAIWGIINNVIKNGTYLVKKNANISDEKTIVNEFNKHFVNIWPRLAKHIPFKQS